MKNERSVQTTMTIEPFTSSAAMYSLFPTPQAAPDPAVHSNKLSSSVLTCLDRVSTHILTIQVILPLSTTLQMFGD